MKDLIIHKAQEKDWPYIKEKLDKYLLDSTSAQWPHFFVAKTDAKTVAFGRLIDHGDYFEVASLGVDYYHRNRGIGVSMLKHLIEEAERTDPKKPIYGVTHRPGFLEKAGFRETLETPEELDYKIKHKCSLHPSNIKVMKFFLPA